MRGPIAWMSSNSVAANLLMFVLLLGGLFGLTRMKQEVFPDFQLEVVQITVAYPGASPAEVEQGMILALEEAVSGVDGVKRVTSNSGEGVGRVYVELLVDTDTEQALADVKSAVDQIGSFPETAEAPKVGMLSGRREVISLIIGGDQDLATLHELAERSRSDMIASGGVSQVDISGVPPREVSIEISRDNLEKYNLSIESVAQQIRAASLELPGGDIDTARGELLVRVADRALTVEDFESIILGTGAGTAELRLGDVAEIEDGYAESDLAYLYNGKPAVKLTAYRIGDETPIDVAAAVKDHAQMLASTLPDNTDVTIWADDSELLRGRIDLLVKNAQLGLVLVLIILALFLELRLAFWVAVGIPITFLGAFFLLPPIDLTINVVSLFAFIITLGLVVDDAIIVGENIYSKHEEGKPWREAAIAGAQEMAVPVTFAVLTTIAAFAPMLFVPGFGGKIFFMIPAVTICVLILSLVESFFILPAHLAHAGHLFDSWVFRPIHWLRSKAATGLKHFTQNLFAPSLRTVLRWRYAATATGVALLVITLSMVFSKRIPFSFFPALEGELVSASAQLPYGTPLATTQELAEHLRASLALADEESGGGLVRGTLTRLGEGPLARGPRDTGSHMVTVEAQLVPTEERGIGAVDFGGLWNDMTESFAGVETLVFSAAAGPSAGAPIALQISHADSSVLRTASEEIALILQGFDELTSVQNSFSSGKPQLDFHMRDEGVQLGLSSREIGQQIRSSFFGNEAFREQRDRDEIKVMVRLPAEQRGSTLDLERMEIRTAEGGFVPLSYVADAELGRSPTSITRESGRQVLDVSAQLDPKVPSPQRVLQSLRQTHIPQLKEKYPGLEIDFVGEQRDQAETYASLGQNTILALFVIYGLLAIPFRSWLQPALIMSAIPFGFVGAIWGHVLMGFKLSMPSALGLVALTGVVVNDSLVLLDAARQKIAQGTSAFDAILDAAQRRFRPILLTSLTTFFGLAPMIFETDLQAQFLIPMAISLGFGVLFVTVVVLLLLPCFYLILDDVVGLFRSDRLDDGSATSEDAESLSLDQSSDASIGQASSSA
jgi:multidrug efflux pump subunit AcrB